MDIAGQLKVETIEQAPWEEPLVVSPGASMREAVRLMRQQRAGGVLVCREAKIVGILTERDVLRLMSQGTDWDQSVESVISGHCVTIPRETTIAAAIRLMNKGGYRRLPVTNASGAAIGVLTVSGIVHYLVQFFPRLIYNLPPKPQPLLSEREGP
ncbi:MAG: CBS domain-containing protein [Planctomycetia bacterium]|nr:CBS domain-containing protein [Planctomycetia bacterium]